MRLAPIAYGILACATAACGSSQSDSGDRGSDATVDAPDDAGADIGKDATTDVATADVGRDTTTSDAAIDATADVGRDATIDATADVGPDATIDATIDVTADVGRDATTDTTPDVTAGIGRDTAPDVSTTDATVGSDSGLDATADVGVEAAILDASDDSSGPVVSYWTQGIGRKVQPTSIPGTSTTITLEAPRDSYESWQIVVFPESGASLADVALEPSDLSDGAGHTLAKANLTLYRQFFIDFSAASPRYGSLPVPSKSPTGDPNLPDPLIPLLDPYTQVASTFAVNAGKVQPVWLDVHVPKDAVAGSYSGSIRIRARGHTSVLVPLTLKVYAVDLPNMREVVTRFRMDTSLLGVFHASAGSSLVKRYEELVHTHRIDIGPRSTSPSSACTGTIDFTGWDAAMTPYMDGTYWSDGVPGSWVDAPFEPGTNWGLQTCSASQYTDRARLWAAHLKTKGWFDRALSYASDEPEASSTPDAALAAIAVQTQQMVAGDPDWKWHIMDTICPSASNFPIVGSSMGVFVCSPVSYSNWNTPDKPARFGPTEWTPLWAQGYKLWFYESNSNVPPWPTFTNNTLDGFEPRILMWGAWYEQATGFLYYQISEWASAATAWGINDKFTKPGDGVLIYPGNHDGSGHVGSPADVAIDGPVPSYRLKVVRAGVQDWALFRLADRLGLGSVVRTEVAKAYRQMGACLSTGCAKPEFYWKTDEVLLNTIRHTVLEAIATH